MTWQTWVVLAVWLSEAIGIVLWVRNNTNVTVSQRASDRAENKAIKAWKKKEDSWR